jgi:hypothetical protein
MSLPFRLIVFAVKPARVRQFVVHDFIRLKKMISISADSALSEP